MRPLTETEVKTVFEKLAKFIGKNITLLIDRPEDPHCFRLHKDRVYYFSEKLLKKVSSIGRDELHALGVHIGKFSKSGNFRVTIHCLDYLAQYAQYKIWVKPNGEMPFLYGNHVLKAHLGRMSEDIPEYSGVVIFNMADVPLGFGVTSKSTSETRKMDPTAIVAFHQADIGEYLRSIED